MLWRLVRGNNNPFKVVIGQDNDIDDLKEVIKEKIPNDVNLSNSLYGVSISIRVNLIRTFLLKKF